jgi:hypothetical protein
VAVNLRGGRFVDVAANRRAGVTIEAQHRAAFARTGGRRPAVAARAPARAPQQAARPAPAAARPAAPARRK